MSQPHLVYLILVFAFLVLMRSAWPWSRTGGAVLLVLTLATAAWQFGSRPELLDKALDAELLAYRLPPTLVAVLSVVIVWWSLHGSVRHGTGRLGTGRLGTERDGSAEPIRSSSRARFVGLALGVLAAALLAAFVDAPAPGEGLADRPSWFLAGLYALAPILGSTYAFFVVPLVTVTGLLLAPSLDAYDPDAYDPDAYDPDPHGPSAPTANATLGGPGTGPGNERPGEFPRDGRRDEVPFFLFAWIAVGVLPIVLAAWLPGFSASALVAAPSGLAERLWLDVLGQPMPSLWLIRELPGLLLYAAIFTVLPWQLPRWKASKGVFGRHLRRLGPGRYALVMGLTGALALVPVKVALYVFFDIGPWIWLMGGYAL